MRRKFQTENACKSSCNSNTSSNPNYLLDQKESHRQCDHQFHDSHVIFPISYSQSRNNTIAIGMVCDALICIGRELIFMTEHHLHFDKFMHYENH